MFHIEISVLIAASSNRILKISFETRRDGCDLSSIWEVEDFCKSLGDKIDTLCVIFPVLCN